MKIAAILAESVRPLTKKQLEWLRIMGVYEFTYENGLVNFEGSVDFRKRRMTTIPVRFGYVGRDFYCNDNKLTSLAGAPREVGGNFSCSNNNLTSLAGAPKEVGRDFYCNDNNLVSLEGAPKEVGGHFYCARNKFKKEPDTSLIKIGGIFQWK